MSLEHNTGSNENVASGWRDFPISQPPSKINSLEMLKGKEMKPGPEERRFPAGTSDRISDDDRFSNDRISDDDRFSNDRISDDELRKLRHDTRSIVKMARKYHWTVDKEEIEETLKEAERAYKRYQQNSKRGSISPRIPAENELAVSVEDKFEKVSRLILDRPLEDRGCWIDRKTIVSGGPGELTRKIDQLKEAGITTVYFECDNGGYSHYDSKLLPKNPDLEKWSNWDPLQEAIESAHANGMKVQAWTKTLSFCNRALDDILRASYPDRVFPPSGPIFSQHDSNTGTDPYGDWVLRMPDGKLPERTHDLFIDPANPKARAFAQGMMLEIASKYPDLDGIQYDYIRYPFHNEAMGMNENNWRLFQSRYPQYKDHARPADPRQMNTRMSRDWNEMKVWLIDSFVEDTSNKLRQTNPKLDISAAVYPLDLNQQLQQEWVKWLKNGWINTLNPMTYVPHDASSKDAELTPAFEKKFRQEIKEIMEASEKTGRVLPGIMLSRINPPGILKEMEIVKQMGLEGETLFASSVLDDRRIREFEVSDSKRFFTEFHQLMRSIWPDGEADQERKQAHKEMLAEAELTGKSLAKISGSSSATSLADTVNQVSALKSRILSWLASHPSDRSEFTDAFNKRLDSSLDSLSAALSSLS